LTLDDRALEGAYARSRERLRQALAPVCPELESSGPLPVIAPLMKCGRGIVDEANANGGAAYKDARIAVAEMRAGIRPMPGPKDLQTPIVRVLIALTGEAEALVEDLTQSLGTDDAERVALRAHGCAWHIGYGW
jgi:hypothetical protein